MPDDGRYAIYWAPPIGSALARLGNAWLGRNADTGDVATRAVPLDIAPDRADAVTEAPRFYGFHGTLKPPFALAPGGSGRALFDAVARFAANRDPIPLPPLVVTAIGPFLALVPSVPVPALNDLAAACVAELDAFRAPSDPADLARRHANGLTARQAAALNRWGYPYVMEDFRFHMTLTGPIADPKDRTALLDALRDICAPACAQPLVMSSLSLFHQPNRTTPFRILARIPLGRGAPS